MRGVGLVLGIVVMATPLAGQGMRAGVARVEVTPSTFGPMYGYANRRCGPAVGTHDALFAKALVLEAGGEKLALVTMDLGSFAGKTIFERVKRELGIGLLLVSSSHTHSGPAFLPSSTGGTEPTAYLGELEGKIFDVVKRASEAMGPARLSVGRGSIPLGYNRLLLREDGRARALFDNLDRVPYGPVDPEVLLLRVEDLAGKAKALVVNYTAHPVALGSTNCLYSADYPGVMMARAEAEMPGVQVMFAQGAAGTTNPLFQGRSGNSDADFGVMTKMGELLAAEVVRAAKGMGGAKDAGGASIAHKTVTMPFRGRWDEKAAFPVGVTTVLVNGKIAIAAVPGEPFLAMQTRWKRDADVGDAFFFGYTQTTADPWPGYLPDLRSAAYGGYGADVSTSIERGAAERIMDQHLLQLFDLRGMWRTAPGKP